MSVVARRQYKNACRSLFFPQHHPFPLSSKPKQSRCKPMSVFSLLCSGSKGKEYNPHVYLLCLLPYQDFSATSSISKSETISPRSRSSSRMSESLPFLFPCTTDSDQYPNTRHRHRMSCLCFCLTSFQVQPRQNTAPRVTCLLPALQNRLPEKLMSVCHSVSPNLNFLMPRFGIAHEGSRYMRPVEPISEALSTIFPILEVR